MSNLIISLLMLAVGPALVLLFSSRKDVLEGLDTFVLVTIAGLVAFHLIPESIVLAGWWAIAAAAFGLILPVVTHRVLHRKSDKGLGPLLPAAIIGLLAHSFIDGIALSEGAGHVDEDHASLLALAVILHRLPTGMAVWWIAAPRIGLRGAVFIIGVIALGTVGGYSTTDISALGHSAFALGIIQALVAGSLLHVVHHHSPGLDDRDPKRLTALIGAGAGLTTIVILSLIHPVTHHLHLPETPLWLGVEIAAAALLTTILVLLPRGAHEHGNQHT